MSFFDELKRRGVFRVAIGYVGVSWLVLQVIDVLFGIFDYETDIDETIVIVLAIGFIPAMILAWAFELTPEGIKRDAETDHDAPAMRSRGRRADLVTTLAATRGRRSWPSTAMSMTACRPGNWAPRTWTGRSSTSAS